MLSVACRLLLGIAQPGSFVMGDADSRTVSQSRPLTTVWGDMLVLKGRELNEIIQLEFKQRSGNLSFFEFHETKLQESIHLSQQATSYQSFLFYCKVFRKINYL